MTAPIKPNSTSQITSTELQAFNEDGFLALPRFLAGDNLDSLQHELNRFISSQLHRLPPEHVFYEVKNDPTTLKQIQQLGKHDPWFEKLIADSILRQIAEQLLQSPVVPKNLQYFNKPAGNGKATPPNQDGYYFMLSPPDAITMWLALDHVDEENGCVRYVKGSHKDGMREHSRTETLGFSQGIKGYPTAGELEHEVACPAAPGDLLVHHALTIHRANANKSRHRTRRALGFIYYSTSAREDTVAHRAYQEMLAQELQANGKL